MMSVSEFFYGNQPTPTQVLRTSSTPLKYQQVQYGSRSPFSHDPTFSRDDHDAVQQAHSRNYSSPSNLDAYTSRYQQESLVPVNSRYTTSGYVSSSDRDYDIHSASFGLNHRQSNFSADFSSPSYSRYSSRGANSKPVSTWVELRVPICCEGCVERLNSHLLELQGVEAVRCDQRKQRVVVRGTAAAGDVLKLCKKLFKRSEFWRYQYDWL